MGVFESDALWLENAPQHPALKTSGNFKYYIQTREKQKGHVMVQLRFMRNCEDSNE